MPSLIEQAGGSPQKQPRYVPIFLDRAFTGLWTQRAALHDPSDVYTAKFYGGRPDALWSGLNVELTNRLTLQRRPGHSAFSTATYPIPPDRSYSFQLADGTIRVIIDSGSTGLLTLTSVDTASGDAVYHGTITGGGGNAFLGLEFTVAGFTNGVNNGTFICDASTATTITLINPNAVSETHAATVISYGAVYWDQQSGGLKTLLFDKSAGAGQTYFQGVGGILYMGDGVDTRKYTPLNPNFPPGSSVSVWNWGTATPTSQPSVTLVASGAAATAWQKNTIFSTMGLTVDAFNQAWQLISVNADGSNPNGQFGTAGNGNPAWNQGLYQTTTEGSGTPIVWKNLGQIQEWQGHTQYGDGGVAGTAAPVAIFDPVNKTIYVNFNNSGGLGTSGTVKPAFNGGGPYWDGGCHWFFLGTFTGTTAVQPWKSATGYLHWYSVGGAGTHTAANCVIEPFLLPPPTNQPIYLQVPTNTGTSGGSVAPFPNLSGDAGAGQQTGADGQLNWLSLGSSIHVVNKAYIQWQVQGTPFGCISDGVNMQVCTTSGTTASVAPGTTQTFSATAGNASGGNTTYTGVFTTTLLPGNPVTITGFTNAANNGTFNIVSAAAGNIVVQNPAGISETHSATFSFNPYGTAYGSTITDGTVKWTCVGPQVTWVAGTATTGIWHLPLSGFVPPQGSEQFGGSTINGTSNSTVQTVISSGKSGAGAEPTWSAVGSNTTDNGITWFAESAVAARSLSWKLGYSYAYSFKSLAFDDFYAALPLGGGNTPPGITFTDSGGLNNFSWSGVPSGSATNLVSTASPAFVITGPNTGSVNTVTGLGSTDPQIDTIVIWRSADGGGTGAMFELTEIPAPKPIGGVAQPWSFKDFLPDLATSAYPGLNDLIPAPIADVNDPPFATFLPMAYNFQRLWGADGQTVPFSGGPDTKVGNPNEAFPPANDLPFLAPVTRLVKTPQGLVTFLTDSIEIIAGGPLTSSFFSVTWAPGIGLMSYNALDILAGDMYFFSADNQFRIMTPSLQVGNAGFAIGDQLANLPSSGVSDATWDPSKVYVASHQNGIDNCVFLADGSTGWYRLNAHQAGANPNTEPVWSPFAVIADGIKMVQSVETAPGVKKLLVGRTIANTSILYRNLAIFTDNGAPYDANFVMGSIMLCHPGQLAVLKFMEFDFSGVSYQPTISYLLNEISGVFTAFTNGVNNTPQFDPPSLYGTTLTPASYSPNRYYFLSTGKLARCRHLQIKVDFGTTSNGDEMYNATIFGRIMIET